MPTALKGLHSIRYTSAMTTLLDTLEDESKARSVRKLLGAKTYDLIAQAIEHEKNMALYRTVNLRTAIGMCLEQHKGTWMTNTEVAKYLDKVARGRWCFESICTTLSSHKGCMWDWKNRNEEEHWSEKVSQKVFRAKGVCAQASKAVSYPAA